MNTALVSSIALLSLYSVVQTLLEKNKTVSRKYLLGVIIILGISQIPPFVFKTLSLEGALILEKLPTRHWVFLIGPLLFLYAEACMGKLGSKRNLLHFLPALIWWVIFQFTIARQIQLPHIPRIYGFTSIFSLLTYGSLIIYTLSQHTKKLRNQFSYSDMFLEVKWLFYIAASLVVVTIVVSVTASIFFKFSPPPTHPVSRFIGDPYFIDIMHSLAVLVFLFFFALLAQKQERSELRLSASPERPEPELDLNLTKQERGNSQEFKEVLRFMESSKVYLDNTLSLEKLSQETGIPRNELSRLINSETGENFFHFINGFRSREFCHVIKENRYPNYNLLGKALECGFNSKGTFNAAIKREFGKTPSQIT